MTAEMPVVLWIHRLPGHGGGRARAQPLHWRQDTEYRKKKKVWLILRREMHLQHHTSAQAHRHGDCCCLGHFCKVLCLLLEVQKISCMQKKSFVRIRTMDLSISTTATSSSMSSPQPLALSEFRILVYINQVLVTMSKNGSLRLAESRTFWQNICDLRLARWTLPSFWMISVTVLRTNHGILIPNVPAGV